MDAIEGAGAIPREGAITATVDLLVAALPDEHGDRPVKLHMVVWSGPDFKTPTISRGAIFDDPGAAEWARERLVEALVTVGIPVAGQGETPEALLPLKLEMAEHDRLARKDVIERLVTILDPAGQNEQLAAWAAEARAGG